VYDPHDAVGRLLFNVLAMAAEFEADLIRLRTKEGMRVAKAKGRLRGRRPKLNARQEAHLDSLIAAGEHSTAEVADLFGSAARRSTAPSNAAGAPQQLESSPQSRPGSSYRCRGINRRHDHPAVIISP
jgi:DNA invertase Pin-like site-specific DNA recombinase